MREASFLNSNKKTMKKRGMSYSNKGMKGSGKTGPNYSQTDQGFKGSPMPVREYAKVGESPMYFVGPNKGNN